MKPTEQNEGLSFKEVTEIFWEWRQASITVEVCFFGQASSSDTVRVSIDGLVSLVDPEGIITISGDGREIELDLRGCRFQHAKEETRKGAIFDPLDPESILQVKFPNGEVCLIFPYRRVAPSTLVHRRASSGLEWLRSKLASSAPSGSIPRGNSKEGKPHRISSLSAAFDRGSKPGIGRSGPPILPLAAFLFVFLLSAFALTPSNVPKLFLQMGWSPKTVVDPNARVWAVQQDGNYYCSGSALAHQKPGRFLKQADALTLGYQPALGHYCGSSAHGGAPVKHRFSAYLLHLSRSGGRIFTRLFRLTRSFFTGSYNQSAAAGPIPAVSSISRGASVGAFTGSGGPATSTETVPVRGNAGSAARWSPVTK